MISKLLLIAFVLLFSTAIASAQTTEFTYQGQLTSSSALASGSFDFEFALFDGGGTQIGSTITRSGVPVTNGVFTVNLDFGAGFPGATRFLEIRVRPAGGGSFTTLTPRQPVTSTPYSIKSLNSENAVNATNAVNSTNSVNAATATNSTQLGGVAANQFVQTNDPRLTDARTPTSGSPNYIQNRTTVQNTSNFNISGVGTANIFDAGTQFNLGGTRFMSRIGGGVIVGQGAAASATSTNGATFVGSGAGRNNSGAANTFVGNDAGEHNEGCCHAFFGNQSGRENTAGLYNSFFGYFSGTLNTTGRDNSFFGAAAGTSNVDGSDNSYFGRESGRNSTSGSDNSFFGRSTGASNTSGSQNTLIGSGSNVGSGNLNYATAIGAGSVVSNDNSVVLGRAADTVRVPGNLITTGSVTVNGNFVMGSGGTALFSSPITLSSSGLGTAGSADLCRNASNQIALCSSSLRYKTNVKRSQLGLDLVNRLRPVTFDWKDGGMHDLGLGAEDVAAVEPLLVTYNATGGVEGVKYDRLGVVLVNAVKEQQEQIELQKAQILALQMENERQKRFNENLVKMVCSKKKSAAVCRGIEK
jgi:hypothetical protein